MNISSKMLLPAALLVAWSVEALEPDSVSSGSDSVLTQSDKLKPGTDQWNALQLARLASGMEDSVLAAVIAVTDIKAPDFHPLMYSLFNGSVYVKEDRADNRGLVIIGEQTENEDYEYIAPLFEAFPEKQALLDASGKPLRSLVDDLREVESSREMRALIQPYLLAMELFHDDPMTRRAAMENLGNRGSLEDLEMLDLAAARETNSDLSRVLKVSAAKLRLSHPDALERLLAAEELRALKSPMAIPALKARLELDTTGAPIEKDARIRDRLQASLISLERFGSMMNVLQTGFIGISLGSILILISLGLAIIYGMMGVINMAHGEFMMLGAYTTFVIQSFFAHRFPEIPLGASFMLSFPVAFLIAGLLGMVVELLVVRHLYKRPLESLLATWGVSLLMIQGARSIFGDLTAVKTPSFLTGGFEMAPQVVLPFNRIFIIAVTLFTVGAVYLLLYRSRFGLKLRAVTQNRPMGSCMGIPVRRMDSLTFFVGTGIAGIAGWAITLIGNVVPNMGQTYIVDSFLVVVTGGVGKLAGALSAGMGIGFLNKIFEPIFQAVYAKVFILGLIVLFLQARPTGIFPAKGRHEE